MGGRNRGDHGNMRPDQSRQRSEFAGMVHAHFKNTKGAACRHTRQTERHAGMIVIAFDRSMDRASLAPRERGRQRLFGAGLADRPRYARDLRRGTLPGCDPKGIQCSGGIRHLDMRMGHRLRHDRPGSTLFECAIDKAMAVSGFSFQGDEKVTAPDLA